MTVEDIERCGYLRKQIYLIAEKGGQAHLASSYSSVEILYTLYFKKILRYDPFCPSQKDRDRIVLSKGHAGLALYSVMSMAGFLPEEELYTYLQERTHIGGEPCMRDIPCVEASTGSLGHGLSMGVGMAIAQKMDGNGARTYVLLGDGECEEGSVWEAAMSASAFHLSNLTAILDCNNIQKMTTVEAAVGEPGWKQKWEAFGWIVKEADGHDIDELMKVLTWKNDTDRPLMLIAHTVKGKGVSVMENNPLWHYKMPNKKERKVFLSELGISEEELL